ncbi:helix-turn-helix transcriptional regulator [Streptomyces sp. ITFR-6]|uniref:helix-turn-helix domain-containing protein n=1 Tax=Streptomyces sp. ITFR-6 TaxID=3075197 RepID=UPI00288B4559|nr:helix-turn-helix transcriptional regulator [Streptomyces sp. ITFR-6]WNI29241.1 helix-turn-helix transcriptional regulator [Streptomyces sp. ITFR-6]
MSDSSSTLLMSRVTFGRALRRLRKEADQLTLAEVATALACDLSLVSRIENGKRVCSKAHFAQLMDIYEVPAAQRDELAELHAATRERRPPWWSTYSDVISAQYERFLGFEAAASTVHEFQVGILPGLLQTEAYAQAVTGVGFTSLGPDQIEALVEVRGLRQRHCLLEAATPLECRYVITQAALDFQVGGERTHREQLDHLLEISAHASVELRVVPYAKGEEAAQIGAFRILQFADEDVPDVAFGESVAGSLTMDDPRDLRRLHRLFRSLTDAALSPDESRDIIALTRHKDD